MGSGGGGSEAKSYGENFAHSFGDAQNWNASNSTSGGNNMSQSQSQQGVWGPQANVLGNLYDATKNRTYQANQMADAYTPTALQGLSDVRGGAMSAYGNQSGGGLLGGQGVEQDYLGSMRGSMSGPNNMQQAYGESAPQLNQMYRNQANSSRDDMMNSMDARAAASGMSGGSGHGLAVARGNADINSNLQSQMALASDRDVDRRLGVASQADQQYLQRQGMMQGDVNAQNAAQQGAMGQANNMNQMIMGGYDPGRQQLQNLGMSSGIIGGPTTLTQSGTQSYGTNFANNQSVGGGYNQNQSDAYGWNSSDSFTNPRWSASMPSVSAPSS